MIENIEISLSCRSLEILKDSLIGEISFLSFQKSEENEKNKLNEYQELLNLLNKNLEFFEKKDYYDRNCRKY